MYCYTSELRISWTGTWRSDGCLSFHMKRFSVYLLYWYKRTNTDGPCFTCFTGVFVPADYIFEDQVRYTWDLQHRWRRIRSRRCHRSNALVTSVWGLKLPLYVWGLKLLLVSNTKSSMSPLKCLGSIVHVSVSGSKCGATDSFSMIVRARIFGFIHRPVCRISSRFPLFTPSEIMVYFFTKELE